VISSLAKRLEKPPFCHSYTSLGVWLIDHYMPLQRSTTGVCQALLWFSRQMTPLAVLRFLEQTSPLAPCGEGISQSNVTKYDVNLHSIEQDTHPITFLICRQDVLYWTCGGTYYPGVSTPKIRSLADSSTTCRDGINHLHRTNCCSNHNIDRHMVNSHLDGWKTTTLSQRHKLNSISQRMEDLRDTQDCIAKHN
jgi:hypothetical protein